MAFKVHMTLRRLRKLTVREFLEHELGVPKEENTGDILYLYVIEYLEKRLNGTIPMKLIHDDNINNTIHEKKIAVDLYTANK